mmetsp:Transcript_143159/g.398961  ORF Transcript_143159/g.398961 Transcript_143159/m.398961 type:complete len:397 (-) Transcript_143159:84-1274(-)
MQPMPIVRMRAIVVASIFAWSRPMHAYEVSAPITGFALPCWEDLGTCVEASGMDELRALHSWINELPQGPYHLLQTPAQESSTEAVAFHLFRDLSLALFAVALDVVIMCQESDPRCLDPSHSVQLVHILRSNLETRMTALLVSYTPNSGIRSAIIRTGRTFRSALDRLLRGSPGFTDGVQAAEAVLELVRWVGQRCQMLAHVLGMHAWVRTLAVPGRGAPVFVLHDEYGAWLDMRRALIANMARNGQRSLALVEVGVSAEDGDTGALLAEFKGLQYLGVLLQEDTGLERRLAGRLQPFGARAALRRAPSSLAAATALPRRAFDIALLAAGGGSAGRVAQDLEWWEARVKPGGVLGGHGLDAGEPGGVHAVCSRRFGGDIHLGMGGTFWWYVEPEEE